MKRKVLILEDDRWFADSLCASLKPKFTVRVCDNPKEIFKALEKWWPDVLLADIILGEKNLFTLLNEIQSYTDTRELPIVILSTAARQVEVEDVAQYNVRKILDKAKITPAELRQELEL
jgi:CheY-like chemotaxis protein